MRKWLIRLVALAIVAGAAGLYVTRPATLGAADLPSHDPDAAAGERMFHAGGCTSCHAAPGAEGDAKLVLSGGLELKTPFGIFVVPNISPDPAAGIGGWSMAEFVTAMLEGTSPAGQHYYPAFPYPSYSRMRAEDVMDLKAYMDTLPPSANVPGGHRLGFPFNIRLTLGGWKLLFLDPSPVRPSSDPVIDRGRYLVEGPGHCGECHTPRNALGGPDMANWLKGGPNPEGQGRIPDITPAGLDWSPEDIAYYLETGFTPEFDSAGGQMAQVVRNTGQLPPEDRQAIAAYLKALP